MATINWSVGDVFACPTPHSSRRDRDEENYGVITSPTKDECILVMDSGMRIGRFTIARTVIPDDAAPAKLQNADFGVKMALTAVILTLKACEATQIGVF